MSEETASLPEEKKYEEIEESYPHLLREYVKQMKVEFPSYDRYSNVKEGSKEYNFYGFVKTRSAACWAKYKLAHQEIYFIYQVCLAVCYTDLIAYMWMDRQRMEPHKNPVGLEFLRKIGMSEAMILPILASRRIHGILHEWDNASLKQELRLIDMPDKTIGELSILSGYSNEDTIFNTTGKMAKFLGDSNTLRTSTTQVPFQEEVKSGEEEVVVKSPPSKRKWYSKK